MTTYTAKPGEIQRDWYLVDAEGKTLGRLATRDRRRPPRQGQARVHAARRHGRLRDRRQRREDPRHGQEARREDRLPALRLPGRAQGADAPRAARASPDRGDPQGGQGHAAEEQARGRAAAQAQGLRRPGAPARRAGPEGTGAVQHGRDSPQYRGTGKRKTSVARVILRPGDGTTWINGRTLEDYFPRATHRTLALSPLKTAERRGPLRPARPRARRRRQRPGRGGPARHRPRARRGRPGAPRAAQAAGLPHARRTTGRAQEGRPAQGAQGAAVHKR